MHNSAVTFKLGRSGENQWCAVIFSLIYFPTVASLVWFVILTYTWFVTQRRTDPQCARQVLDKQRSFFHLAAWCLPLVLSVACLTIAKVKHSTFLTLQGLFMHYLCVFTFYRSDRRRFAERHLFRGSLAVHVQFLHLRACHSLVLRWSRVRRSRSQSFLTAFYSHVL